MRGIRGAITVKKNNKEEILAATMELLNKIIELNRLTEDEMVSINFTATTDLDQVYPAVAAREIGLKNIPLLCYQEMKVINSLPKCIRVLIYVNRSCTLDEIRHVYLEKAEELRPDLRIRD